MSVSNFFPRQSDYHPLAQPTIDPSKQHIQQTSCARSKQGKPLQGRHQSNRNILPQQDISCIFKKQVHYRIVYFHHSLCSKIHHITSARLLTPYHPQAIFLFEYQGLGIGKVPHDTIGKRDHATFGTSCTSLLFTFDLILYSTHFIDKNKSDIFRTMERRSTISSTTILSNPTTTTKTTNVS